MREYRAGFYGFCFSWYFFQNFQEKNITSFIVGLLILSSESFPSQGYPSLTHLV
jgi:hypothetical protein